MKHLYEPPANLLPLIKESVFSQGSNDAEKSISNDKVYYQIYSSANASLYPIEVPKLDGLALSFILATPDAIDYTSLYSSLIKVLESLLLSRNGKTSHYSFSCVWRLLLVLPPSKSVLNMVINVQNEGNDKKEEEFSQFGLLLLSLIVSSRASHKSFGTWMKDCLVKQG